jgi:lipoprotein NlpD
LNPSGSARNVSKLAGLALVIAGLQLAGCASPPPGGVPVIDRNQSAYLREPLRRGQHRVQSGETLYSIAFRFGWDWKALAQHNRIPPPYVIYPGQTIRFSGASKGSQSAIRQTVAKPVSKRATTASAQPIVPKPASPSSVKPTPAAVATPTPQPASSSTSAARSSAGWVWPSAGELIGRFASNASLNKGIDIAGQLGQPVLAASDGLVVYAGSGLRGYGELLIIKHDDVYVSAYGHNRRLLVREGQQVKAGQTIAEMGSTGTDRVKLHFEIRRQGKPVDPQQYLPRR